MVSSNMRITDFIQSKEKAKSQERGPDAFSANDLFEPEARKEDPLLSQVKELPEDSQEYSFLTDLQFPSSHKSMDQAPVSKSIHYLHGDKITRHPGKKFERYPGFVEHKRAFYSSKEDLLQHLQHVSLTQQKKIRAADLNIEFSADQLTKKLDLNQGLFRCAIAGPMASSINKRFTSKIF